MKEDDSALSQSLSQLSLVAHGHPYSTASASASASASGSASAAEQHPPAHPHLSLQHRRGGPRSRSPRSQGLEIPIPSPTSPLKPLSRHASPSPRLPPPRSPSIGPEPDSRSGTPTLLRKASMNSLHSANGMPGRSLSRRSSYSQISPRSNNGHALEPEKPPMTASSMAKTYFQTELEAHHGPISTLPTETVVILNDAVYGHRFSRPRTSKGTLSTIVERPERVKASVVGVSMAYVRLGERHSEGAFSIHPKRNLQHVPSIPFRIHKTTRRMSLSSPAVTNVHGAKWMEELKAMCDSAESVLARGGKELTRPTTSRSGDHATPEKLHEGDLYLCAESLEAMEGALGAVCEAVDTVFSAGPRRAFVAVRPPGHHCSASHPSGFCWVNNVHVGIMHGMLNHGLTHAAIIDFDLHHGDGSQSITWAHNARAHAAAKNHAAWKKTSIGYFSIHDINSYPCEMGDMEKVKNASVCIENAHGQTVWNVHLESWNSEEEFWQVYQSKYLILLEKTRKYLRTQAEKLRAANQQPRAAIFISAGFDASEWESPGMQRHQVNVPTEFYARLTQDVIQIAAEEGLCVDGRIVSVLEGGYSDRALYSGIFSHLSGLVGNTSCEKAFQTTGLDYELAERLSPMVEAQRIKRESLSSIYPYDPAWWSGSELDKFDVVLSTVETPPKMPRPAFNPTYSSPTQSSTAKIVDPLRARRSMSSLSTVGSKAPSRAPSRGPTPPPPEVTWMIAARELSKLLIPNDRQVNSFKAEELNAEATRLRRERQSSVSSHVDNSITDLERPTSRMSLRDRKPRAIAPIQEEGASQAKNRRKTVATSSVSTEKVGMRSASTPYLPATKSSQDSMRGAPAQPSGPQLSRRGSNRRLSGPSAIPSSDYSALVEPIAEVPSRPTSSMNARAQTTGKIVVRKTRQSLSKEPSPRESRRISPPAASSDDLNNLTTGMKKIKINLLTKAQIEAREKARQEAEAMRPPSQREQQVISPEFSTPMPAGFGMLASPGSIPALTATSGSGFSTPMLEQSSSRTGSPERHSTPYMSSPGTAVVGLPPLDEDFFVPYQPEGPAPVAVSQDKALQWLPPTVSSPAAAPEVTPSPTKKSSRLFHYTNSIPFAPRPKKPEERASPKLSPKERLTRANSTRKA